MARSLTGALPLEVDALGPEWLSGALSIRHPGTEVAATEIESITWGTATKVFLRADYAARPEDGPPAELCVKGGFQEELRPVAGGGYQIEAGFYRDIAPRLRAATPSCWYADDDPDHNQGLVILDDLRATGARFGSPREAWSIDDVAAALELHAGWHASTWDRTGAGATQWLTVGSPLFRSVVTSWLEEDHWNDYAARPQTAPLDDALRDRTRVRAAVWRQWALDDSSTLALSHGDPHVGNTYIDPDRGPLFLDWQTICLAPWSDDVTYFVVGALSVEDRRAGERDLLRHYLEALAAAGGPALGFDEAWREYGRHHLHGVMFSFCPPEMQDEDVCTIMAERYGAAASDHDTLRQLEA